MSDEIRTALLAIVVEDRTEIEKFNAVLSEYNEYIIGRMGLPHRHSDVALISIAIEAPSDVINTLSGKIGQLKGITSKSVMAKVKTY